MKPYKHLKGYLERWTIFCVGRLHIRIHHILCADKTPFLHTHPFAFISVILSGGYVEQLEGRIVHHKRGHVIMRMSTDYHRIESVEPNTKTLVITFNRKDNLWNLKRTNTKVPEWVDYPIGVYERRLYGVVKFSKFDRHWCVASTSLKQAFEATRPSIDQSTPPIRAVLTNVALD